MGTLNDEVRRILESVKGAADYCYVDFDSISATNTFGDNALHCLCVRGDFESVKILVENGIDINQEGEFGYSPLDEAEHRGYTEIADYLKNNGARNGNIDLDNLDQDAWNKHMSNLDEHIKVLKRSRT